MRTVTKAYNMLINDEPLHGQTVELSLDQLYFGKRPEFPNESQWMERNQIE